MRISCVWLACLGCTSGPSTSELNAWVYVTAGHDQVAFQVSLMDLSNDREISSYVLGPDEHVSAKLRDQVVELRPEIYSGYVGSVAIDAELAVDEEVSVVLDRGDETITLSGTAPIPFAVNAAATTSREHVLVSWQPIATDPMRWTAWNCRMETPEGPIREDRGRLDFPPNVLSSNSATFPCTVDLSLWRSRGGLVDSDFHAAFFFVHQVVTTTLTVAP